MTNQPRDQFGPDYLMAEHLLGATAYGYLNDDFDEVFAKRSVVKPPLLQRISRFWRRNAKMTQPDPDWAYNTCCGNCGPGLCYVDQITGEADEGYGWEYRR